MTALINLPYQQNWLAIGDQYKFGLWARQTGKTTMIAQEIANFGPNYRARVICPSMSSAEETAIKIAKHTASTMRKHVDQRILTGYSIGGRIFVAPWRELMSWHEFMGSDVYADEFVFYCSGGFAEWLMHSQIGIFPNMRVRALSSFEINHNLADFYQYLMYSKISWSRSATNFEKALEEGASWLSTDAMLSAGCLERAQLYMNRPF